MVDEEALADDLYAVPPSAFMAARSSAVAEARAAGEKAVAARLTGLRKPTVSAWLCNQLVRTVPDDVAAALDLGAEIRDATVAGDRDALRTASRRRTTLLTDLVARARVIADEHGQTLTAEMQREIESTFTAAAADAAAAEQVLSGRLTSPLTFEGLGFDQGALPPPRDPAASRPAPKTAPKRADAPPAAPPPSKVIAGKKSRTVTSTTADEAARTRAEQEAARAIAEEEERARITAEAEQALAVARLQQADADAELADAQRLLEEAVRTEADAEAAYQQAQSDLVDARADVRDAKKDVTAANRSVVSALARLEKVTRPKR